MKRALHQRVFGKPAKGASIKQCIFLDIALVTWAVGSVFGFAHTWASNVGTDIATNFDIAGENDAFANMVDTVRVVEFRRLRDHSFFQATTTYNPTVVRVEKGEGWETRYMSDGSEIWVNYPARQRTF